ncbi:serine/threonine-protein kinase [Planctomycetes bacterium Poly30]|uniref:WD40 repeat domain-containing serine/threonine protein kinase n=1 Tax=Saltatorellus ferox TaxID=2528018 RepID=UPI0011A6C7FD
MPERDESHDPPVSPRGERSKESPATDDSLAGLDLDLYADVDRLTDEFTAQLDQPDALDAQAFAKQHPALEAVLLPALRAVQALRRSVGPRRGLPGPLDEGDSVGRFRILGELGRGGMGIVYEASEAGLERPVALKVLDGTRASEGFKQRFLREARAAARLEHPAIVPVYGTGEDGGLLWYAMRKIEGVALDGLLQSLDAEVGSATHDRATRALLAALEGRAEEEMSSAHSGTGSSGLGPSQHVAVARIGQRLAAALGYAHGEGVLHRDIKPGNVLLDEAGHPHLTDFGLCKLEGEASLTEEADVIGTLRYMPPEALTGESDARGDIYGLGLVLYELLTRRPAFPNRQRAQLIHDIERRELVAPRSIDPSIPGDLERIVAKATAKLPEERYASADAFHADLTAFLSGKPIQARPLGLFYMLRLLVRRHRLAASVAAIGFVALTALGITYVVQLRSLLQEVTEAKREAVHRGALATIQLARTQLEAGELGATQEILRTVPIEERGWGWKHVHDRCAFLEKPLFTSLRHPEGGFVLPNGHLLLWGKQEVQCVDADRLRRISSVGVGIAQGMALPDDPFSGAAPSGEGDGVLVIHERSPIISSWSGDTRDGLVECAGLPEEPVLIASNVEAGVAAAVTLFDLYRLRLPGGEVLDSMPLPKGVAPSTLAVLPSGDVVVGSARGDVRRFTVPTGEEQFLQQHRGTVTTLLVEDGQLFASADDIGEVRFRGVTVGVGLRAMTELGHPVRFLWRADETTILAGLESGEVARLDRRTGAERRRDPLFLSPCVAAFPALEDGGVRVLSTWGRIRTLGEGSPAGALTAASSLTLAWMAGFSPDAARAAFVSHDGFLNVVGESLFRTPCETRQTPTSFHRDGRLAAASGLVVDTAASTEVLRWAPPEGECTQSCWLGDELALLCWRPSPAGRADYFQLDLWLWDSTRPGRVPEFSATVTEELPWIQSPRVAVLAEERALLIGMANGKVVRWDVEAAAATWQESLHGGEITTLEVDLAAGVLYSFGGSTELRRTSLATGEVLPSPQAEVDAISKLGSRVIGLDVSVESSLLATLTDSGWLHVFDLGDGSEVLRHDASALDPVTVEFMPGGQWASVSCASGDLLLIGHGVPPAWATEGRGFVDPDEVLNQVLAWVPEPRPAGEGAGPRGVAIDSLHLRTAICVASYGRPTTLDDRAARLRERLLEYVDPGVFKRIWAGTFDGERDRFGRYGWMPAAVYAEERRGR